MARFFKNARKYIKTDNSGVQSYGWEWDEYHIELVAYAGLEADIAAHVDALEAAAIAAEEKEKDYIPDLLSATAALEDALCEQDSANEERLAAIEDALCELDKEEIV